MKYSRRWLKEDRNNGNRKNGGEKVKRKKEEGI